MPCRRRKCLTHCFIYTSKAQQWAASTEALSIPAAAENSCREQLEESAGWVGDRLTS